MEDYTELRHRISGSEWNTELRGSKQLSVEAAKLSLKLHNSCCIRRPISGVRLWGRPSHCALIKNFYIIIHCKNNLF